MARNGSARDSQFKSEMEQLLEQHDIFWGKKRKQLMEYRGAYTGEFWETLIGNSNGSMSLGGIRGIQTADAYKFIESYVSVLFLRQPGVQVTADAMTTGSPTAVESLANFWISKQRRPFENVTKLGLLYPQAYLKMHIGDYDKKNVASKVTSIRAAAINPWDVVVDMDADSWEDMRYVAHIYWLPQPDAARLYPNAKGMFKPTSKDDFFQRNSSKQPSGPTSDRFKFVKIVQFWDFQADKLIDFTFDVQGGWRVLKETDIPVRDSNDRPMSQLLPLIFSWKPDSPLEGISSMTHVIDQIYEKNKLRTQRMRTVDTNARKTLFKKDAFTPQALNDLLSVQDGTFIGIDSEVPLGSLLAVVPTAPLATDFDKHGAEVDADIRDATALPANARGDVTGVTATEAGFVNSYAKNEIEKFNTEKGVLVQRAAHLFNRMLVTLLEDKDKFPVDVHGNLEIVTREKLQGSFIYLNTDGNTNPIVMEQRKRDLIEIAPVLVSLGVPKEAIKEEIVRTWELPKSFLAAEAPTANDPASQTTDAAQTESTVSAPSSELPQGDS